MISSFLDRQRNMIILDRLVINDNGIETLITEPEQIKEETIKHFQNCAGSSNEDKHIPDNWQEQYRPKDNIDSSIYGDLMSAPTLDEWLKVLQQLPKSKAAGPSKITNEMLQHLGTKSNEILWKFISACLQLNDRYTRPMEKHPYIRFQSQNHGNVNLPIQDLLRSSIQLGKP